MRRALERSRAGAPLLLPDIAVRVGPMAGAFKAMLQVSVSISLADSRTGAQALCRQGTWHRCTSRHPDELWAAILLHCMAPSSWSPLCWAIVTSILSSTAERDVDIKDPSFIRNGLLLWIQPAAGPCRPVAVLVRNSWCCMGCPWMVAGQHAGCNPR